MHSTVQYSTEGQGRAGHVPNIRSEPRGIQFPAVFPLVVHHSVRRVVQAKEQVQDGRLAAATGPHDSEELPHGDEKRVDAQGEGGRHTP